MENQQLKTINIRLIMKKNDYYQEQILDYLGEEGCIRIPNGKLQVNWYCGEYLVTDDIYQVNGDGSLLVGEDLSPEEEPNCCYFDEVCNVSVFYKIYNLMKTLPVHSIDEAEEGMLVPLYDNE